MPNFARVLAPTDFSRFSFRAADFARAVANRYHGEVHFVHVAPETSEDDQGTSEDCAARLDAFVSLVRAEGIGSRCTTLQGDPADKILEQAELDGADLICLGTHGRQGVERLILGSVAETVLRRSSCPVLTVSEEGDEKVLRDASFSNILCALDFAPCSLRALDLAFSLAEQMGSRLTVLSVVEWLSDGPDEDDPDLNAFRSRMQQSVQERVDEVIPEPMRRRIEIETVVRVGKPYREILAELDARDAELVIMGVRGRNPLDLMLFGSTTHRIVRLASCPVLTTGGKS